MAALAGVTFMLVKKQNPLKELIDVPSSKKFPPPQRKKEE